MNRNNKGTRIKSLICIILVFAMCVPQLLLQTGIVLAADEQETAGQTEVTGDQMEPAQETSEEIRTEDSGSGDTQTTEGQIPGNGDGEMQTPEGQTTGNGDGEMQTPESQTTGNGTGEPQTDENKAPADEGGEPLTEETRASERESETDAGSEGYENGRDVIEWTQDTGHLILELEKAVYMNKNQERFTAANKSGSIDLTKAALDEMSSLSFELSFDFTDITEENKIIAGDTFSVNMPMGEWSPVDGAAGEVRLYDKAEYKAPETGIADGETAIGTYSVTDSLVTVTFNENAEEISGSEIFGVISIPFEADAEASLDNPGMACEVILQEGRTVQIMLPAKQEETETDSEPESESEPGLEQDSEKGPEKGVESEPETSLVPEETEDAGENGLDLSSFRRSVMFFSETAEEYSIQNPRASAKTFKNPADGVSKVKITLVGSDDGYQADSDLGVIFSIDIVLDDEYLYLQHSLHEGDAGYPAFGGDIDAYNARVDEYLEGLSEEELPSVVYTFNLGTDFVLPGEAAKQEVDLVYETGGPGTPENLGKLTVEKQSGGNWTASVIFDKKVYNRESVTAGKTLDLQVAEDKLDINEPVYVGWDGALPKVGTMGSLTPDDPDKPQAPEYSVTKEAPDSVTSPYIDYVISADAKKEGRTLAEMILVDVIPADMEVISVIRDGRELTKGEKFSEDTYLVTDAGELQYQFPAAKEGQEPVSAQFTVRLALTGESFRASGGDVARSVDNTAYLRQKDGQTEAAHSEKVSTSMNIHLLEKDGRKDGLNGLRYSWTLDVNTQFSELVGAYIVDTVCWDDHMYDAVSGLQVYNEKGRLVKSLPISEKIPADPIAYASVTKENIEGLAGGETDPFYYKYSEGGSTYAVLIIPFGSELQNQKLKLKYYTEVNIGNLSVDKWQEENSNGIKKLTNNAKFIWNRYTYGVGPGWNDFEYSADLNKEISDQVTLGTKSAGNYDETTRRMQWKFTVNGYGANLNSMSVADILPPDKYELDSVEISYRKYLRDGSSSAAETMGQDSGGQKPYFSLDTSTGNISIHLGDVSQQEYYEIFLDAVVMDPEIMSNQGDNAGTLSNTAVFKANVNGKDKENQLTAEKTVPNTLIAKEAVGGYDYSTREIAWKTTVDMNHIPVTGMALTDILPAGSSFSELSRVALVDKDGNTEEGKVNGSADGSTVEFDSGIRITLNITEGKTEDGSYTQDTAVFKFTDQLGAEMESRHSFVIEYKTRFTDEAYLRYIFQNDTQVKVLNEAVLTGKVRGTDVKAGAAAAAALYIKNNKISKNGTYDSDEGLIHWQIMVNESRADLQGMKILDRMENQPLEIDDESVTLSKVDGDGNAELLASRKDGSTGDGGFKGGLAVSPQEISYTIPADYGTETLLLEFDTVLTESATADQISNRASLMDRDAVYQESNDSNGGYTGDFDMDAYVQSAKKPVFQILKTSSNDDRNSSKLPLAGARFRLEAYMDTDGDGIYTPDTRYDKAGTTGMDGKLAFVNLKWDTVYHITETEAAKGYQLTAEDRYYIFKKASDDQNIQLNVNGGTKNVICMTGGTAVGGGDGEFAEANLVIHNKPDADLEIKFIKKYPDGTTAGSDEVKFELKDKKGQLVTKSAVTDENGIVSFGDVDPGDYTLTEIKSPDPYDQGVSFDVTLKADKTYTITLASGNASVTTDASQVSIVSNDYARGTILLKKTDSVEAHQIPLAGAVYTLCDDKGIPVKDIKGEDITAASSADGILRFENISYRPGGYILTETVSPDGYEEPGALQQVTVSDTAMKAALAAESNSEGKAKTFTVDLSSEAEKANWQRNTRTKGSVSFTKKNDAQTPEALSGRQFKLLYNDSDGYNGWTKGTEAGGTAEADGTGTVTFTDIPYGNYRLVEVTSEGDIYQEYAKDFTLRSVMADSLKANREDADQDNNNIFNVQVADPVINTLIKGSFSLIKTDGATEEPLKDVIFKLTGTNAYGEEILFEEASSAEGTISFDQIPVGDREDVSGAIKPYLLSEVRPDGYVEPAEYHIYVKSVNKGTGADIDNEAEIRIVPLDASGREDTGKAAVLDPDTPYEIKNTPVKGSLEFKKVSAKDSTEGLKGAEYTLYRLVGGVRADEEQIQKNSALSPITGTSKDDGIIKFENIEYGNYELAETKAPSGYQLDPVPVQVTKEMLKDGLSANKNEFAHALADVSDEPTSLSVEKQDQFGQAVTGAVLKLTGKFADEELTRTGISWTTDGGQKDISQNLIVGESYTLTEVSAPDSGLYRMISPVQFTVESDGSVHMTGGDTNEYSYSEGVLTLKDYYYLAQVELVKTDSVSKAGLPDVVFSLYKQTGEEPDTDRDILIAGGLVTGPEGRWDSSSAGGVDNPVTKGSLTDGLCPGSYYFVETSCGERYKLDQTPQKFEITQKNFTDIPEGEEPQVKLNIENEPIEVKLQKVDSKSGEMLEGAEFTLMDLIGSSEQTVETGDNGTVILPGIVSGRSYRLEETKAPAGYILNDLHPLVEFTVEADGSVSFTKTENTSGNDSITGDKTETLIFADAAVKAGIRKLSPEGDELTGWEFSVTGIFAEGKGKTAGSQSTINVSDSSPELPEGRLIAGNSYQVKEIKAPAGYIRPECEYTICVNSDGTLVLDPDSGQEALTDNDAAGTTGALLKITDQPLKFGVDKVSNEAGKSQPDSQDVERVTGAVLEIRDENGSLLSPAAVWTSDGAAPHMFLELPAGSYQVVETEAPYGYCTAGPVAFRLNDNNTIEVLSGPGKVTTGDDGIQVLQMTDTVVRSHVKLVKMRQSETGREPLEGAAFNLYMQKGENADITEDILVSADILTNASGSWTTEGNAAVRTDNGQPLSEGLRAGKYYFYETETGSNTWLDPENRIFSFEIEEKDHGTVVEVNAVNAAYISHVSLKKVDSVDNSPVSGAEFTLFAEKEGQWERTEAKRTDVNGEVFFDLQVKGRYRIAETKAAYGYQLDEGEPYTAEFTADDSSYGMTLALQEVIGQEEADAFAPVQKNAIYKDGSVANLRELGILELTKTDREAQKLLNGVEFTLFREDDGGRYEKAGSFITGNQYVYTDGQFTGQEYEEGKLKVKGLDWGNYYIQETRSLEGYQLNDSKFEFTIGKLNGEIILRADQGSITNEKTNIFFYKYGRVMEDCADPGLEGVPEPGYAVPKAGAEFTIYKDGQCSEEIEKGISRGDGRVEFTGLPEGTYYIKETKAPAGCLRDDTVYKAALDKNGMYGGLYTEDEKEVTDITIVNDVARTDITLRKVSEQDLDLVLPGSEYGLYKKTDMIPKPQMKAAMMLSGAQLPLAAQEEEWILIARAVTDEKGILAFKGVLMDTEYMIRELKAPDGSQVSANPVSIQFTADKNGKVRVAEVKDGNQTAEVDLETGEIVWREPPIMLGFWKRNTDGDALAGAVLQLQDMQGNVVDEWISSDTERHIIYGDKMDGKIVAGNQYKLVETAAPQGYAAAEPVIFTVEASPTGPNENAVQEIVMTDEKQEPETEESETEEPQTEEPSTEGPQTEEPSTEGLQTEAPSTEAPSTEKPKTEEPSTDKPGTEAPAKAQPPETKAPSGGEAAKTADNTPVVWYLVLMAAALCAELMLYRKRKGGNRK